MLCCWSPYFSLYPPKLRDQTDSNVYFAQFILQKIPHPLLKTTSTQNSCSTQKISVSIFIDIFPPRPISLSTIIFVLSTTFIFTSKFAFIFIVLRWPCVFIVTTVVLSNFAEFTAMNVKLRYCSYHFLVNFIFISTSLKFILRLFIVGNMSILHESLWISHFFS